MIQRSSNGRIGRHDRQLWPAVESVAGREPRFAGPVGAGGRIAVQIIVVDPRLARARTFTLTPRKLVLGASALVLAVVLAVVASYWVTFRLAVEFRVPFIHDRFSEIAQQQVARNDQFVRDNIASMARKLGEMQAQLLRLDALGERVAKIAGVRPEEFSFSEIPGRGGPAPADGRPLSLSELQSTMDRLAVGVESRADFMDVVESELLRAQVRTALLPRNTPVMEGFVGSPFGNRIDPITGQMSMHAGIDFAAPPGTPIFAAAGGVVVTSEWHPVFGNLVEVDHGNEMKTLYAHSRRTLVKVGDIVRKGQQIAEVGSTGRSTGPHLHFEVHLRGQPQNPSRFLALQRPGSPLGDLAAGQRAAAVDIQSLAASAAASRGVR